MSTDDGEDTATDGAGAALEAALAEDTTRLLRSRFGLATSLFLLFIGFATGMEGYLHPDRLRTAVMVYSWEILVCLAAVAAVRLIGTARDAAVAVGLCTACAAILALCLMAYAVLVGLDTSALAMALLCWITVVAVLLPWGGVAQTLMCLTVLTGFLVVMPHLPAEAGATYSVLALVAASTGSVLGGISLDRYRRAAFVHAARLERASALERENSRTLAGLLRIGDTLSREVGRSDGFTAVARLATELLGCDFVDLYAFDAERDAFVLRASHGHRPEIAAELWRTAWSRTGVSLARAIRGDAQIEIAHVGRQTMVPAEILRRFRISSILYSRIERAGEVAGILACGHNERTGAFASQERHLAQGVASALGVGLENLGLIDDLKSASRLKSEFISMMSHELRTPLNAVVGYIDLLAEGAFGELTQEQTDAVGRARRGALRLTEMISATLDISRLEAGRETVLVDSVDMAAILRELAEEMPAPEERAGVTLTWSDGTDSREIFSDPVKIKTILRNLVGNALKFTPAGAIDVLVDVVDDTLLIEVRDSGVGIAPETLPVIFEMFRQGDASPTRRFEGVGLGLFIVKGLVDLLGGTIEVESTPGVGSTFRVRIPTRAERSVAVAAAG